VCSSDLGNWKPPTWDNHFVEVENLLVRMDDHTVGQAVPNATRTPVSAAQFDRSDVSGAGRRDEGLP
jgi:hypothetical protein